MLQITKECSCVHGTRTEAGLATAPAKWTPVLAAQTVASEFFNCLSYVRFQIDGIRGAASLTPSL